jgi:hypothetical protein
MGTISKTSITRLTTEHWMNIVQFEALPLPGEIHILERGVNCSFKNLHQFYMRRLRPLRDSYTVTL